jgi:glycosyltransferase involved in cell wall biosynthesis
MRVGLLADRLDRGARRTGVGSYIEGLVSGLAECERHDEFVLFSWGTAAARRAPVSAAVERQILGWPRRATAASWTLLGRPRVGRVGDPIDLLHILVPTVPVPSSKPVVATIHDLMPLKHPRLFRPRQLLLFRETVRRIRRSARHVIAISESTKRDVVELLDFDADRVDVVHPGLPLHFAAAPLDLQRAAREELALGEGPLAVFVGEVAARKNVRLLVEAFGRVAVSNPEAQLVLAGSRGRGGADVDDAIERLRLRTSVHVLGHAPQSTVEALVAAADVLVLPSVDEGFGFPALEAMSVGTAVVASDAGALPEVVDDAGLLVPAGDVDALADALARVLGNDELRADLGRRGERRAATFSWATAARKTIEVYDDALG